MLAKTAAAAGVGQNEFVQVNHRAAVLPKPSMKIGVTEITADDLTL